MYISHPQGRSLGLFTYMLTPGPSGVQVESAPGLIPCFPSSVRRADWRRWLESSHRGCGLGRDCHRLNFGRCWVLPTSGRSDQSGPPCPIDPFRGRGGARALRAGRLAGRSRFTPPRLLLSRSPRQPRGPVALLSWILDLLQSLEFGPACVARPPCAPC